MSTASNISGNAAALSQAMKELRTAWDGTSVRWRDMRSAEFYQRYLDALPQDVARAVAAMESISDLLKKVRRDCE